MKVFEMSPIRRALVTLAMILTVGSTGWAQSTATTLSVSAKNVPIGSAVTLTASVSSGGWPVNAGFVAFCDADAVRCNDSAILGSAWVTKSGTASLRRVFGPGTHNIQAAFKGTNSYTGSVSATQVVTVATSGLPTTSSIGSTGAPGNYVMTATVATASAVVPTGSVSFLDTNNGNYSVASAALGLPQQTWNFAMKPGPPAVTSNQAIVAGDFNNDGKLDYVIANLNGSAVATVMLGNGDGTFTKGGSFPAGGNPEAVVAADFNGDGNLDLAFANSANNGVTILLGKGDGTFTAAANPAVGWAASIAVGDFNGDGIPDLAVGNDASDYVVTILLGNGDGTFTVGTSVPILQWSVVPQGVVALDFNGDGKTDLAVTSANNYAPASYLVTILLGNGDGTFSAAPTVATGTGPYAIVAGDFNNDGKLDLATANYSRSTVTIMLGNGDGTFTASSTLTTGSGPDGMAAGDFNGDGLLDIVTANYRATTGSVLLQAVTSTTTVTASGVSAWGDGIRNVIASYSGNMAYQGSSSSALPITGTPVAAPVLSLASGTYPAGQSLTISSTTPGVFIYYTTDGTTPTKSSTSYTGAITLNSTETVSAIAIIGNTAISSVTSASYSIAGGPQTITFGALPNVTYGVAPITLSATASSGLAVSYAVTSGPATLSGNMLAITGAGTVMVTASQAGNGIYSAATPVTQSFTVNAATPSVTVWPTASSITFGQTLGSSILSGGAASVSGTFGFTNPATAPVSGTNTQGVVFTPTDLANNNSVSGTVNVTAVPAAQTITVGTPAPASAAYKSQFTVASGASSGLPVAYTSSGGCNNTGATYTMTSATISCTVMLNQAGTPNYSAAPQVVQSVTASKAVPTVTWPSATSITFGQTLASSTLSGGSASISGDFSFITPTMAPGTGTAAQSVTFTPFDSTDYASVTGTVNVTVIKATPVVRTWPSASSIGYGQTLASSMLSGGVVSTSGSFAFTTPTTAPGAGTAAQSATFTPADTTNYLSVTGTVKVTVSKAALTVTANNQSKSYGQILTLGTTAFTPTGLVNGDTVGSVTLTSPGAAAAATVAGSPYSIVPSAATGGTFATGNYSITYASGTLTVARASSTISLTSAPNPSILGQVVTLTATVTSGSTKIPSGDTVTFKDGGTTLGTKLTKSSGVATFTTTALSVGTHSITAVYAGDSNIATSTSLPLSHAVTGAATKLVWQQQPASSFDRNTTIAPPMTVLIEDASGNVVNSSASVKISLNTNGSDKVAGTVTAKAVNGVATFSDINITGNQAHQSATFIASSTGLASAVSITFTIN
jgi:hypothetical protein